MLLTSAKAYAPPMQHLKLLPCQLQFFSEHRYCVIKNWLSVSETEELRQDAMAVDAFGATFDCHVGQVTSTAKMDTSV